MFRISKKIRSSKTRDGAVILDIHQNRILATNLVGAKIFELMQSECTEKQIADEISQMYGISIETSAADIVEFAESLMKCGVLVDTELQRET